MLPTGYPKWLRLERAGQSVRARYAALQEAVRALADKDRYESSAIPRGPLNATRGARLMRTLETARQILKTYAHWESRIVHVDVVQAPALDAGEDAVLIESGSVLNQTDSTTSQPSSSDSPSPESAKGVINTTKV